MNTIHSGNAYTQMLGQINQLNQNQPVSRENKTAGGDFGEVFGSTIQMLEQKQVESNEGIQSLINGTSNDLHSVMIKTTEAQLSLEVAVQLRNRALDAYNEIKNMQF